MMCTRVLLIMLLDYKFLIKILDCVCYIFLEERTINRTRGGGTVKYYYVYIYFEGRDQI